MIREQDVFAALPKTGFLRAYVDYAKDRTDAHAIFHVAAGLTLLTQTVPVSYSVPHASPIWANNYTLLVGPSSTSRKTSAINLAQRVLDESIPGSVGEIPGSQEGLYEALRQQPRQAIFYGEFGEFLAKAEEGYMMPIKTAITNLWDGIPIGRALANQRRGVVKTPRLSLLCGVATSLLERHTEQADWTGGFLARFLTFYAEPEREFASMPVDDFTKRANIVRWLNGLANHAGTVGHCLWLDPPSHQRWVDWFEEMRPLREGANRRIASACARATSMVSKVALLLAWDIGGARSGGDWHVGVTELESAIKIVSFHLDSAFELGERVTGTKDMRDRAAVLAQIATTPTPLGIIIKQAELLKYRVRQILESLIEERSVEAIVVGGEPCYVQTPHRHQMLRNLMTSGVTPVGNVFPIKPRPAPLGAPVVVTNEDDDGWSSFEG